MTYFITKSVSSVGPAGDAEYWVDLINNDLKKISLLTEPPMTLEYWTNYNLVYDEYVAANELLFRGKYVENKVLTVISVWVDETRRLEFLSDVNADLYEDNKTFTWDTKVGFVADANTVHSEIQSVLDSENYVIRTCAPEFEVTGMVVGDMQQDQPLVEIV